MMMMMKINRRDRYQTLFTEQTEEQSVSHLPQVLETNGLQLGVLHDVLQLVVEELQDSWAGNLRHIPVIEDRWTAGGALQ